MLLWYPTRGVHPLPGTLETPGRMFRVPLSAEMRRKTYIVWPVWVWYAWPTTVQDSSTWYTNRLLRSDLVGGREGPPG